MRVGDLVELQAEFMGEPVGTKAVVYEEYTIGKHDGISIITENGVDLGGFSVDEQKDHLKFLKHTPLKYQFRACYKLDRDFELGLLNPAFGKEIPKKTKVYLDSLTVGCTKGHEWQCALAISDSCDCECGGTNHGKAY